MFLPFQIDFTMVILKATNVRSKALHIVLLDF